MGLKRVWYIQYRRYCIVWCMIHTGAKRRKFWIGRPFNLDTVLYDTACIIQPVCIIHTGRVFFWKRQGTGIWIGSVLLLDTDLYHTACIIQYMYHTYRPGRLGYSIDDTVCIIHVSTPCLFMMRKVYCFDVSKNPFFSIIRWQSSGPCTLYHFPGKPW